MSVSLSRRSPRAKGEVPVLLLAALLLVAATVSAADLRITDSRGTEVVVQSAAIDYGGFMGSEKETEGIRLMQGDGSVVVKWTDIESLKVIRRDESIRPPRIELEVVLRNQKKVPAALLRQGRMKLTGKTELGDTRSISTRCGRSRRSSDRVMKNLILSTVAALLMAAPASQPAPTVQGAGKPNILFLFADDMRADTIAAMATRTSRRRTSTASSRRRLQLPRQLCFRRQQRRRLRAQPGDADERQDLVRCRFADAQWGDDCCRKSCGKTATSRSAPANGTTASPRGCGPSSVEKPSCSAACPTTPRCRFEIWAPMAS